MASLNYTLRPPNRSDVPVLSDLLYNSKLTLTINRLLFKDCPNEQAQRKNYASVFDGLESSPTETVAVCDAASGEVVGLLAFARKRPSVDTDESASPSTKEPQNKPDIFNQEVLGAVMETVKTLSENTKGLDHYGGLPVLVLKSGVETDKRN
ncbi:uncharacterized protein KD926_001343 [Aspergillus affinis]|uniref:uncharacterized protein n=1 Tax=Aspergillus affinis TaxID=1070780 RepID=UPI0022FE888A|nr:uncharacterized protein KD926_001343 [Aspergillus affinis]KAI9036765.1 hypothetical protein KD926_001343 [Aspergillus affinis]